MQNQTAMRSETFEWFGPTVGPRVETGMSGLAYLTGIRDGAVRPPALGPLINAELVDIGPGKVQLICSAPDLQFGRMHELDPGLAGVLLGAAVSCVAQTLVGLRQSWTTVAAQSSYIRSASPRVSNLVVTAQVIESVAGRSRVTGELADDCGQVLATVSTTIDVFDL
jgi:acyl-coenzyme A thioesterase PaaI-like protein